MKTFNLPVDYDNLSSRDRKLVREQYIQEQNGLCWWCNNPLNSNPSKEVQSKRVNWNLFPVGFKLHPIHLQHNHDTGLTEGAVHMLCNAVMWQYYDK